MKGSHVFLTNFGSSDLPMNILRLIDLHGGETTVDIVSAATPASRDVLYYTLKDFVHGGFFLCNPPTLGSDLAPEIGFVDEPLPPDADDLPLDGHAVLQLTDLGRARLHAA